MACIASNSTEYRGDRRRISRRRILRAVLIPASIAFCAYALWPRGFFLDRAFEVPGLIVPKSYGIRFHWVNAHEMRLIIHRNISLPFQAVTVDFNTGRQRDARNNYPFWETYSPDGKWIARQGELLSASGKVQRSWFPSGYEEARWTPDSKRWVELLKDEVRVHSIASKEQIHIRLPKTTNDYLVLWCDSAGNAIVEEWGMRGRHIRAFRVELRKGGRITPFRLQLPDGMSPIGFDLSPLENRVVWKLMGPGRPAWLSRWLGFIKLGSNSIDERDEIWMSRPDGTDFRFVGGVTTPPDTTALSAWWMPDGKRIIVNHDERFYVMLVTDAIGRDWD